MISPGQSQQLKCLNLPRALDVGASTEIGKPTVGIKRNRLTIRNIPQPANFVWLFLFLKEGLCFRSAHLFTCEELVLLNYFPHLRFDFYKVFLAESMG